MRESYIPGIFSLQSVCLFVCVVVCLISVAGWNVLVGSHGSDSLEVCVELLYSQ